MLFRLGTSTHRFGRKRSTLHRIRSSVARTGRTHSRSVAWGQSKRSVSCVCLLRQRLHSLPESITSSQAVQNLDTEENLENCECRFVRLGGSLKFLTCV